MQTFCFLSPKVNQNKIDRLVYRKSDGSNGVIGFTWGFRTHTTNRFRIDKYVGTISDFITMYFYEFNEFSNEYYRPLLPCIERIKVVDPTMHMVNCLIIRTNNINNRSSFYEFLPDIEFEISYRIYKNNNN
jgi:hypothetical protein